MVNQLSTPWAVLLCKFKDDPPNGPTDPPTPIQVFQNFFTTMGTGTNNAVQFFSDMSHGSRDLSGSQVFWWLTIDATKDAGLSPDALVRLARQAASQSRIPPIHLDQFFGDVVSINIAVGGSFGNPDCQSHISSRRLSSYALSARLMVVALAWQ